MTRDQRDQLVEDIRRSNIKRDGIVEMARASAQFDILAAWEEVEPLDESITRRIREARSPA
jgi:hypothetical protein